ncbi:neuromedin-S isoform X2 [Seriola lalandi dorsalis]|uniref:neuromedin-S isoform X2 n=1 Tax=Seriola lalandi dorsalis TaxID=1841481 RepID=UPI000C6F7467|nr:neuromedin-S isoform X2 [Seriola lalandi dorsalis]
MTETCALYPDASPYDRWEDGLALRQVRGIQSNDLSDVLWRDQNEEQVQNVFKRFLFHYSKARNSVGAVQHESHSVHPLMRLSPKLSQRRKKVLLLVRKLKLHSLFKSVTVSCMFIEDQECCQFFIED